MPIVYSAQALRQPYVPPVPKAEPCRAEQRKPAPVRLTAASEQDRATVARMWGKPLGEIAVALGCSTGRVSRIAREIGLPSRKHAPRTPGPKRTEKDARLAEVWGRSDLSEEQKAMHCGFSSAYTARRRARQIGLVTAP